MLLMEKIEHVCKTIKHVQKSKDKEHKLNYLRTHNSEELQRIFWYTYNPLFDYGISREQIENYCGTISDYKEFKESIFDLLDDLMQGHITGCSACGVVLSIRDLMNDEVFKLLLDIISRDLKLDLSINEINDVFDNKSFSQWYIPPKYNDYLKNNIIKKQHKNKYVKLLA